jgi:hypothetical protein
MCATLSSLYPLQMFNSAFSETKISRSQHLVTHSNPVSDILLCYYEYMVLSQLCCIFWTRLKKEYKTTAREPRLERQFLVFGCFTIKKSRERVRNTEL